MSGLPELIQALDARRTALLSEVGTLRPEELRASPTPGIWSVLEVVEHLVAAEQVILQGLPDPATLTPRPRELRHRLTYPLVWAVLRFGIPVKAPSRRMLPTGGASLDELRTRWEATYRWLRTYAAGLAPGSDPAVFRHPVCGPLTLRQALRLDRLHLEVHARQIRARGHRGPA